MNAVTTDLSHAVAYTDKDYDEDCVCQALTETITPELVRQATRRLDTPC